MEQKMSGKYTSLEEGRFLRQLLRNPASLEICQIKAMEKTETEAYNAEPKYKRELIEWIK